MNFYKPEHALIELYKNRIGRMPKKNLIALECFGIYIVSVNFILIIDDIILMNIISSRFFRVAIINICIFVIAYLTYMFIKHKIYKHINFIEEDNSYSNNELYIDLVNEKIEPNRIALITERIFNECNDVYKKLIELLPDAIHIKYKGRIVFSNDAGAKLYGFNSPYEFIGRADRDFVHPDYQKQSRERGDNIRSMGKKLPLVESKIIRCNGEIVDVEVASTGISLNGEIAILSVIRDITSRKKAEEAIRKISDENKNLLEKVLEIDKLKTEFFSNISHEFRTPLNVILGAVQLLKINLKENYSCDKYLNIMQQNCYRLLRLINNLIDITKVDSNYLEINYKNFNIINIIEDITLSVADYAKGKGINIIFDTEIEEKMMACDVDKIERIMLNLLSNAIKYSKDIGNIYVNVFEKGESIIISVKDNGIGIPKDKVNEIFDRFKRVDSALNRNCEGSGIGLALVKSLVEKLQGNIWVESKWGEGTEFFVKLPVNELSEINEEVALDIASNSLVEKINIEFSDIYKLK